MQHTQPRLQPPPTHEACNPTHTPAAPCLQARCSAASTRCSPSPPRRACRARPSSRLLPSGRKLPPRTRRSAARCQTSWGCCVPSKGGAPRSAASRGARRRGGTASSTSCRRMVWRSWQVCVCVYIRGGGAGRSVHQGTSLQPHTFKATTPRTQGCKVTG